jgi:hypothetical protein
VLVAGLSADHNLVERSIPPLVVIRVVGGPERQAAPRCFLASADAIALAELINLPVFGMCDSVDHRQVIISKPACRCGARYV